MVDKKEEEVEEKVYAPGLKAYMNLFCGRDDVYGINQFCLKEPLTKDIYDQHLTGVKRIGVYPIFDRNKTWWMTCDIDEDDFNQVLSLYEKITHYGLNCYIERSKSKGYHIWTFFKKPIEAVKVRLVFEMMLDELDYTCELFPKQDEVVADGYGNFIFLPLFGGDISREKTIFIDENKNPIAIKATELKNLKKNDLSVIDEIIENNNLERKKYEIQERSKAVAPNAKILPCIEAMRQGVKKGHRNEACYRLSIYLKQRGAFKEDVYVIMNKWNSRNDAPIPQTEIKNTIESVWRGQYKGYGCEDPMVKEYCVEEDCPMKSSKARKQQIEEGVITMTYRDKEVMVFKKQKYEFRLSNFEFSRSGKFKCALTLTRDEKMLHKDFVNLGMGSNRKRFVTAAKDEEIDHDMISLEDLVRTQLAKEAKEKIEEDKQLYVMTEVEKQEALRFLEENKDILSKVIDVTNRAGVVGEEELRLMIYLCFTSRITEDPISITVKGESSSGKSYTSTNILNLIPEEGCKYMTKATQQAFFHMDEDGLEHRIVFINEAPGQENADYSIRSAQSEGDLILLLPIKDAASGDMHTVEKRVRGPVGFLTTTTKASIFDENETRNFSVFSDDSPELTKKIGEITIRKAKGETFDIDKRELNLMKNVQRLLNPDFKVIIPYASEVFSSFPTRPVRIRRDRERFRVLIEVITLLHQFHRKQEKNKAGIIHLVSTLADYYIAKLIAEDILTYTIHEIGPSAEALWGSIQEEEENFGSIDPCGYKTFTFTYRTMANKTGWKKEKVKKWMYSLVKSNLVEYAEKSEGGQKKESVFKIVATGAQFSAQTLNFLPKIEDLFEIHPCDESLFYNPVTMKKVDPVNIETPDGLLDED